VLLRRLWLGDFRSYEHAELTFPPGFTAIIGDNGEGKTNLLEAIAWLATLDSFRGAPLDALVRVGAPSAVIRAEVERDDRELLLEAQLVPGGRNRVQINRQPLRRARELLGALRVTVFTPDDLIMVKGGPAERRRYIDDALVALHPRHDTLRSDLERVLRQRGALLKQAGGRLTDDVALTLDVWDRKLVETGEELTRARLALLEQLAPVLAEVYAAVARDEVNASIDFRSEWFATGLAQALEDARATDVRRGVSTVGPHRDDLALALDDRPARTHASQGEQRSLALALRLAAHHVVTRDTGTPPVLLLDDVFSELDPDRSAALLAALPTGQTLLTTAAGLPAGAVPDLVLRIQGGTVAGQ
jgi:DNA replication and repair protein RecF